MALQAHSREEPPDAMFRCELLLALGDAQTRAGDMPAAKQTFLLAAELARHTGVAVARAALGYGGRFLFNVSRDDPRLRLLLEEALADLGNGDSELRAMPLARLAGGPLRDEPSRERRASLSKQAVDIARRMGDPVLLGYVLDARFQAIWAADNTGERLAIAAEMVQLSESTGDLERLFQGHAFRIWALLELGDLAAVSAEVGIASRVAADLRQPAQLWMVAVARTLCALLEGRFEEAEELIEEAFRLGERTVPWNAAVTRQLQLFALRREQRRLDELEATVRRAVHAHRTYPVWRCVLARDLLAASASRASAPAPARPSARSSRRSPLPTPAQTPFTAPCGTTSRPVPQPGPGDLARLKAVRRLARTHPVPDWSPQPPYDWRAASSPRSPLAASYERRHRDQREPA